MKIIAEEDQLLYKIIAIYIHASYVFYLVAIVS